MIPFHVAIARILVDIFTGRARFGWSPWHVWKYLLWTRREGISVGFFRGVRDRDGKRRSIGFRWGVFIYGFEFGNRTGTWELDRAHNVHGHRCWWHR